MFKKISLLALLAVLFTACSSEEDSSRDLKDYVSAALKGNDDVMFFGSVDVKTILEKTDYENNALIGDFIGQELAKLETVIDMDKPIYYVVEQMDDVNLQRTTVYMKILDADLMAQNLEKDYSYFVQKEGDIQYAEDNEFAIGFKNDLAIAVVQPGDYDAGTMMKAEFAKVGGDISGGKIDELLATKADIFTISDMSNAAATNTELSKKELENIRAMSAGSYMQMTMNFNPGAMEVRAVNHFTDDLSSQMFFKETASSDIKDNLLRGNESTHVIGGVTANIDIKKLEAFYKKFAPEAYETMQESMSDLGPMMTIFGAGDLMSTFITGEVGMLMIEDDGTSDVQIGTKSYVVASAAGKKAFMLMSGEVDLPDGSSFSYKGDGIEFIVPSEGGTNASYVGDSPLNLPVIGERFGKAPVFAFVDFDAIKGENMAMLDKNILDRFDYATLEISNEGGVFTFQMKNKEDNFLKQLMDMTNDMIPLLMTSGMVF